MIKNIIFDIGGIILDVSDEVLEGFLNKTKEEIKYINRIVYGKRFNDCLLGDITHEEYMKELISKYPELKNDIEKLLLPKYQKDILPLKKEVLDIIYKLKSKSYKIYFLSNLTEVSYYYIKDELNILKNIDGGIYSWKEHLIKPQKDIYELLIERYNLDKSETLFFDDTEKNVVAANKLGIRGIKFKDVSDILNEIDL